MTAAEIRLTMPSDSRFVATARVTTASIAAELDYSVDEIEELRVGVNELVAAIVEWAEDHAVAEIHLRYGLTDDALEIEAHAGTNGATGGGDAPLDELTGQILSSVVDDHEIHGGWGRILKRRVVA